MFVYPEINPVAFHLGSWPVYWYGLMYLVGFLGGYWLLSLRCHTHSSHYTKDQLADLVFYVALGAIIGGRLGYMVFYDTMKLIHHPLTLFQTWKGGMSFHGGLLGVLIAVALQAKHLKLPFLAITDFIAPVVPIGLGAGRIGNFINGELWGRVTDLSFGMVFPHVDNLPRHASQLYEFFLEGMVLFIILWIYSKKPRPLGAVSGLFALLYGLFRSFVEFFREPDIQIGYLFGGITEGQLLSIPLILIGIYLLIRAYQKRDLPHAKLP